MGIEKLDESSLALAVGGNSVDSAHEQLMAPFNEVSQQLAELVQQLNGTLAQYLAALGPSTVSGGAGHDVLIGDNGDEVFLGGGGADVMIGMDGENTFLANDGDRTGDVALGGAGQDTYVWAPGSGNDMFDGGAGRDTLTLQNVTPWQVLAGLQLGGMHLNGLLPHFFQTPNGIELMALNAHGQPQAFSGSLRIGGEILVFSQIERITFPG